MRKSLGLGLVGLLGLNLGVAVLVAGCAATAREPSSQATIAAAVDLPAPSAATTTSAEARADERAPVPADAPMIGQRVQHHVEITVDRLPMPKSLHTDATTYVFWVRGSEEEAWSNAAHLEPSDDVQEALFAFPENDLFVHVTAEPRADARQPSSTVLLSTHVSKLGACASSVDQNHLKMRVRMCSDEKGSDKKSSDEKSSDQKRR
jgi:hypothetical protein